MITEEGWRELEYLEGAELKGRVFAVLAEAAEALQTYTGDDPSILSAVPRLYDLLEMKPELSTFREAVTSLARSVGLWNYIDRGVASGSDLLLAESLVAAELDDVVFHRQQIAALNTLLAGRNLILSAPTSFGKSLLIDALLASGRYSRVAVVVPTIALLDETRRRLARRFGAHFKILMYGEQVADGGPTIFLGTQERLINRTDIGHLDLLIVDEFYKLDPARADERSITLNSAVYRLLKRASQFFFLGPNIENVRVSDEIQWKFEFLHTRFSTVAVNTYDLRGLADRESRLVSEAVSPENSPALVFASSPDRANLLANAFLDRGVKVGAGEQLADWIDQNYGAGWSLSDAVRAGIGLHHGRVPRALASRLVSQFNDGSVPILICTSTLIEGVNTAAKSVLIYDKKINRKDHDFFTFSNIKGRAGRLGKHHTGNVFLFDDEPAPDNVEITAPLFEELSDVPDDMLVYIEPDDTTDNTRDRLSAIQVALGLSAEEMLTIANIGIEKAYLLRDAVESARKDLRLDWSGYAKYENILALCEVLAEVVNIRGAYGLASPRHLAFYIVRLRDDQPIADFFRWHMGNTFPQYREGVFKFLRACEYGIPQLLAAMIIFVRRYYPHADYSLLEGALPRFFRHPALKHLDEQGIPMQLSERFVDQNDTTETLARALLLAKDDPGQRLSDLERQWIEIALGSGRSHDQARTN